MILENCFPKQRARYESRMIYTPSDSVLRAISIRTVRSARSHSMMSYRSTRSSTTVLAMVSQGLGYKMRSTRFERHIVPYPGRVAGKVLLMDDHTLTTTFDPWFICALSASGNEYDGKLGARISSIFVIWIISTLVTVFPVAAKRVKRLKIPLHVYLFARFFGSGVIVATAFIHLLDPAYGEIGYVSSQVGQDCDRSLTTRSDRTHVSA
ncbi:hypothetical protein KCU78_g3, partial [Aureobasidium melanogenum]